MDPVQFVRDQLVGSTVNAEEFNGIKQNMMQLTEEVNRLKTEVSKITSVLKQTQSNSTPIDGNSQIDHNDTNQSMENNMGDSNHTSMLNDVDESALFDDSATQQTLINATKRDLNEKSANKIISDEFTMEIIEVDVVAHTSMELLPAVEIEKAQNDDTLSNSTMNTSDLSMHNQNDSGADLNGSQKQNGYNGNDAHSLTSNGSFGIENEKFTHALNAEMVIEDAPASIDDSMAPKNSMAEMSADAVNANMDINIEDLPIIMKSEDAEDQL